MILRHTVLLITVFLCSFSTWSIPEKNISITVEADSTLCAVKQKIYLYYRNNNEFFIEDSAEISPLNKEVTLYGCIPHQIRVDLFFEKKGPNDVILVASPRENIKVKIAKEDGGGTICKKVIGSPATNEEAEYTQYRNELIMNRLKLYGKQYAISDSLCLKNSINDSIKAINEKQKSLVVQSIKQSQNPDCVWGRLVVLQSMGFSADSIKKLQTEAQVRFPDYIKIQLLGSDTIYPKANEESRRYMQIISTLRRKKRIQKNNDIPTMPIINQENTPKLSPIKGRTVLSNFHLPSIQGDTLSLSQCVGKYTILDFWASWCLPCLKELYVIKQIHENYNNKINICLISLDTNKTDWKNAIKRYGLESMTNLFASDAQNYVNKDIERLDIRTIPANYILNPQGHIVAYDIFGPKLINTIDSLITK